MALTKVNGMVPLIYDFGANNGGGAPAFGTGAVMDATAEKIAFVGQVWHPTVKSGIINLRKTLLRCGAITLAAGSEVRVSLQDVSPTAGPPYQPDGVQDQFYDFKTATTALTQNAWNSTGNMSADRAVDLSVYGIGSASSTRLAVVFEYQAFTAADSVIVSTSVDALVSNFGAGGQALLNTGSWASIGQRRGIVAFECDDGSYAFLSGNGVPSAVNSATVGNAAAIRRAGLKFRVPQKQTISRIGLTLSIANGTDGDLILYDSDGTTALVTLPVDNDAVIAIGPYAQEMDFVPVTLLADTYYRLAFVPSVATTSMVHYMDVNAAGLMDGCILGQDAHWTQHDGSVWTDTTTRRPLFALGLSAFDNGQGNTKMLVNSGELVG